MSMEMNLIRHGQEAELRLRGYIDATNANEVEEILSQIVRDYSGVTLDMANLEYVSSAGLRAFKHAYIDLRRKGSVLCAKNVNKTIMEVFELTGFTRLFKFI